MIARIDATIQKGVDAAAMFFMRRFGWGKSFLRYALGALFATTMLGKICARWTKEHPALLMIESLLILCWLGATREAFRQDIAAENKGLGSPIDAFWLRGSVLNIIKFVAFGFILQDVIGLFGGSPLPRLALTPQQIRFFQISELVWDFTFLLMVYLVKTPNTPPPRKVRARAPVPAGQSA